MTAGRLLREITSNQRFFCRGGRERLRGTCGGWDELRKRDRWRCGCVITEDPCALVRAGAVPEFWVPNFVSALVLPSLRPKQKQSSGPKTPEQLQRERSEEHTSELQSPDHLVCRLLL